MKKLLVVFTSILTMLALSGVANASGPHVNADFIKKELLNTLYGSGGNKLLVDPYYQSQNHPDFNNRLWESTDDISDVADGQTGVNLEFDAWGDIVNPVQYMTDSQCAHSVRVSLGIVRYGGTIQGVTNWPATGKSNDHKGVTWLCDYDNDNITDYFIIAMNHDPDNGGDAAGSSAGNANKDYDFKGILKHEIIHAFGFGLRDTMDGEHWDDGSLGLSPPICDRYYNPYHTMCETFYGADPTHGNSSFAYRTLEHSDIEELQENY